MRNFVASNWNSCANQNWANLKWTLQKMKETHRTIVKMPLKIFIWSNKKKEIGCRRRKKSTEIDSKWKLICKHNYRELIGTNLQVSSCVGNEWMHEPSRRLLWKCTFCSLDKRFEIFAISSHSDKYLIEINYPRSSKNPKKKKEKKESCRIESAWKMVGARSRQSALKHF